MTTDTTPANDDFEIDWNLGADVHAESTAAEVERRLAAIDRDHAEDLDAAGQRLAASMADIPVTNELAGGRAPRSYLSDDQRAAVRARNAAAEATPTARARRNDEIAAERAEAEAKRRAQAALDGAILVALSGSEGGTYPHGAIVNWRPVGTIGFAVLEAAAIEGGATPPARRSTASMASSAVNALKAAGYKVETVKRGAHWRVYRSAGQRVALGESIGESIVNATLGGFGGEELDLEGPATLAAIVREAFENARAESTLTSADVTSWLGDILDGWRAVPTCYGRWIAPGEITERWLRLAGALAKVGVVPARPAGVMAREDIRGEIETGLQTEVANLVSKITSARDRAREESKRGEIGIRAATTLINAIADARAKLTLFEVLVGPMAAARAELDTVAAELALIADDTAQRGANLELD